MMLRKPTRYDLINAFIILGAIWVIWGIIRMSNGL